MIVVIDIGGTKTRIAAVKNEKLRGKEQFSTIYNYKKSLKKIIEVIKQLSNGEKIEGIGVSIAAICSQDGKSIVSSVRLKDYVKKSFVKDLTKYFKTKCLLMNDAACSALAEAGQGAGKGKKIVVYVTISTGINGACVTEGKLNRGNGFQFGHQIICSGGKYWKYCGQKGCLEAYASGLAFEEKYGLKPENCKEKKIWEEFTYYLSIGITNIILLYAPEIVVIGGGLSKAGDKLFKPLNKHIKKQLQFFPAPLIVRARLKDESGLTGAKILIDNLLIKKK